MTSDGKVSSHGVHKTDQTAFRLAPGLLPRLKAAAARLGETMTGIVNRALATELDRIEGRAPDQEKRDPDDSQ